MKNSLARFKNLEKYKRILILYHLRYDISRIKQKIRIHVVLMGIPLGMLTAAYNKVTLPALDTIGTILLILNSLVLLIHALRFYILNELENNLLSTFEEEAINEKYKRAES